MANNSDSKELIREYALQFNDIHEHLVKNPLIEDDEKVSLINSFGQHLLRHVVSYHSSLPPDKLKEYRVIVVNKQLADSLRDIIPDDCILEP